MKYLIIAVAVAVIILAFYFYSQWSFQKNLLLARDEIFHQTQKNSSDQNEMIAEEDLTHLPSAVKKWLKTSGVVGKRKVKRTKLVQSGYMRLKPEQQNWIRCQAEQVINIQAPAFVWNVKMKVNGIPVLGIDKFLHGEGSILITLLGLFPIAKVAHHAKINQSALQRFLGEIVWTPSAALAPEITWTSIDENTAKANMTVNGISGDAIFYFTENGDLKKFIAMRFKEVTDKKPLEWHADVKEVKVFDGIRIPSSIEATWILPEGSFTWFKFEIKEIEYK